VANKIDDNKGSKNWLKEMWNCIVANKTDDNSQYNDIEELPDYIRNRFTNERNY
jgi:hypothetical protein